MPKRLTVDEVHALAKSILVKHGCSDGHADAVADTVEAPSGIMRIRTASSAYRATSTH